jgi:hypothetical protein
MCSFLLSAGPVSAFSSAPPFLSRLRCLKQPKRPQGAPPTWWPWPRHFWTKPSQANDKMSVRENSFQASGTPCGVRDVFNRYPGVSRCSTPGYCLSTLRVGEARQMVLSCGKNFFFDSYLYLPLVTFIYLSPPGLPAGRVHGAVPRAARPGVLTRHDRPEKPVKQVRFGATECDWVRLGATRASPSVISAFCFPNFCFALRLCQRTLRPASARSTNHPPI